MVVCQERLTVAHTEAHMGQAVKRNQNSINTALGREFKGVLVMMEASVSAPVAAWVLML